MSRGNKWVPIDKYFSQEFKNIQRPFSKIEAIFSYTLDRNNGLDCSIAGYSKLWSWSRDKVRKFINDVISGGGHISDKRRPGNNTALHFIDNDLMNKTNTSTEHRHPLANNANGFSSDIDSTPTGKNKHQTPTDHRQITDTIEPTTTGVSTQAPTDHRQITDTSTNPNPKPKEKISKDISPHIKKTKIKKEKIKMTKKISSDVIKFSENFIIYISNKDPRIKSDLGKSADTIDKLIRIDKYQLDYIKDVLKWAVRDDFWETNIYSLAPLRTKSKNGLSKFQNIANSFETSNKKTNNTKASNLHEAADMRNNFITGGQNAR